MGGSYGWRKVLGQWKTESGKEGREANQGVEAWLSSQTTSDFSGGYIAIETPDTQ